VLAETYIHIWATSVSHEFYLKLNTKSRVNYSR